MTEKFVIGLVGAPFGLEGFVKVRPLSGETGHFKNLQYVTIRQDGREKTATIEEISLTEKPDGAAVLMRFKGYENPEKAKALCGAELIVDRKQASPLAPGEFYIEDLKGVNVYSPDGKIIGRLKNIIEGAGELAEIALENGETRLVPFLKEFFSEINPEINRIELRNLWVLE
jgi:16S rRNA processing protein RimM